MVTPVENRCNTRVKMVCEVNKTEPEESVFRPQPGGMAIDTHRNESVQTHPGGLEFLYNQGKMLRRHVASRRRKDSGWSLSLVGWCVVAFLATLWFGLIRVSPRVCHGGLE